MFIFIFLNQLNAAFASIRYFTLKTPTDSRLLNGSVWKNSISSVIASHVTYFHSASHYTFLLCIRTPKISTASACQNKRTGAANSGSGGAWSAISQWTQSTQGKEERGGGSHLYSKNKYSQNMN